MDWHAGQHADAPKPGKLRKQAAETAGFLLDARGPREHPAAETAYSCSPHRVEMLGRLVRDDYLPREGNAVLALLPDWVEWCADRASLPAALEAARAEAAKAASGRALRRRALSSATGTVMPGRPARASSPGAARHPKRGRASFRRRRAPGLR